MLELSTQAVGGLAGDFFEMSLFTSFAQGGTWSNDWTVFYWAWPLAWSPFAGLFIARISRGRSVREVAFTGIGATAMATIPWFSIGGGTAVVCLVAVGGLIKDVPRGARTVAATGGDIPQRRYARLGEDVPDRNRR